MSIRKKNRTGKLEIDISGPAGNAFALKGAAESLAKQLEYTPEQIETMIEDMKSSDYDHLVDVFDIHFGEYVDLVY